MYSNQKRTGYLLVLPAVLFMLLVVGYPLVYNIVLSFREVNLANLGADIQPFVGFESYKTIFTDILFKDALLNTILYTVISILLQFVLGFALALFFSLDFKYASFFRGLMMVSWLIPQTVTGMLFQFLLSPSVGILNHIAIFLGAIEAPLAWLSDPQLALFGIIIANIWVGVPFNMLLLATGINDLPQDVYEAAEIDGANWWEKFTKITIPLLKPTIMVVMMQGFIFTFKVFDLVLVMTGGGPANSTQVLSTLSYKYSFQEFDFGTGSAVANILFLILFGFALIYIRFTQREED